MTILKPLGLLSLISLIILLLIYILKPNFQQKMISSTFIWKLSLKYKKKKLPINKFRNILLIICQIIILLTLTAVLVKPVKIIKATIDNEVIVILDASASMRTNLNDETRYQRAVDQIYDKVDETFENGGIVSLVVASNKPYFLVERGTVDLRWEIEKKVKDLTDQIEEICTYGKADLDKATELCQDILAENPNANIFVYTDLDVDYVSEGMHIINVTKAGEHNIAILNAYSEVIDNYYSFVVELASYGRDVNVGLKLEVKNANITELDPDGVEYEFDDAIDLNDDQTKRVIFINSDIDISANKDDENTYYYQIADTDKIFSFRSVHISIDVEDCFEEDNSFDIYGGTKEPLKILYASSESNPFVFGILVSLQSALNDRFDVQITEFKKGTLPDSGFDLYIYEHTMMPTTQPTDGVVMYFDPQVDVAGSGFVLRGYRDLSRNSLPLTEEETHELTKKLVADNITVSRYSELVSYDSDYKVLMTCDGKPMIMVQDNNATKTVVMLFSLHYSNLPLLIEFPLFFINVFDYFLPATIEGNSFEVSDSVTVRSRSENMTIIGNVDSITLETFPSSIVLDIPGTYTIEQTTYFGKDITEQVFVKVPASESNIFNSIDTIENPIPQNSFEDFFEDYLFYLSIVLACFLFLEWILKGKEGI